MKSNILAMAAASAALAFAGPVLAQQSSTGKDKRTEARESSQGRANASERGRERANQNSALADVQPGTMVHDANGRMLGRVKEVRRSPDGVVILVIVILQVQINGSNTIQLSPSSLSFVNGVLVTTQVAAPTGA